MKEVTGNLIQLAKEGNFDAIGHGCNCFCRMKRGIAPLMAAAFGCDKFPLEDLVHTGDFDKLGRIEGKMVTQIYSRGGSLHTKPLMVFNMYSQYHWNEPSVHGKTPVDYTALRMCLRKLNKQFTGQKVGLPRIGCGLAGGDWEIVKKMMEFEMKDCDLIIVSLEANTTSIETIKNDTISK